MALILAGVEMGGAMEIWEMTILSCDAFQATIGDEVGQNSAVLTSVRGLSSFMPTISSK